MQLFAAKSPFDFSAPHKAYFDAMMRIEMLRKELEIREFRIASPETPH
jgi:hypothetical protein